MNLFSHNSLKWHYSNNVDTAVNQHGKRLDIFEIHNILLINHSKYYGKQFDGCFTYSKANKKSQIDLLITNNEGRRLITDFEIVKNCWHTSDHLPLEVKINIPVHLNAMMILKRSRELEEYVPSQQPKLKVHRYAFDINNKARNDMALRVNHLNNFCDENANDSDRIVNEIDNTIIPIIKASKMKKPIDIQDICVENAFKTCDNLFEAYINYIDQGEHELRVNNALDNYQRSRNTLRNLIAQKHENDYLEILNEKDSHALWHKINWSGKLKSKSYKHPEIAELADHFETLYEAMEGDEAEQINLLYSDTYIPVNDDPISERELYDATKNMKKGGWDFSLPVLNMLMYSIPNILLLLMNLFFFCAYQCEIVFIHSSCNTEDRKFTRFI